MARYFKSALALTTGVVILSGVSLQIDRPAARDAIAFIPPAEVAAALCTTTNGINLRRQVFIRAATAYAAELDLPDFDPALPDATVTLLGEDIATDSAEAQSWFNRGLALTFGFNHGAAVEAFRLAQAADPDCAMCYWGEAFALGPNINAPMDEESAKLARAAAEKALALSEGESGLERDLIEALALRYAEASEDVDPFADFADAMDEVALAHPENRLVAVLAAEANMDTQAWDYWQGDGWTPKGRTARTLSLLEGVLAKAPDYPPAIHLYIHLTEASTNPYRALPYADRLAELTPGLGHLIHMPSHTYYRVGQWKKSIDHNIAAVETDEAFLDSTDASILYEYGYFTHNIHFALTSAQMGGDAETALAMADKLDAKLPADMVAAAPWIQPIKAAPYYAMAQFGDPEKVLDMPAPEGDVPFITAAWHYARGEAHARLGDAEAAREEAAAIAGITTDTDFSALTGAGVPVVDVLNIARLTVLARAAAAEEDYASAVEAMEQAVAIEDAIPYMEPPYWYYPAKQTLAAMVLQAGQADRARQLFYEVLVESPNNAWALFGLAQSYRVTGQMSGARQADRLFRDAWLGDRNSLPTLNWL